MKVGLEKPTLATGHKQKPFLLRSIARCNWAASWFYFGFNNVALIRFAVHIVSASVLLFTIVQIISEFQQREMDRAVRVATLFSQIAHLHSLPNKKGLKSLKSSVEALASHNVPMSNINLSGADLSETNLVGVRVGGANLSGADFFRADLRDADFRGADLSMANLSEAKVAGANFSGANLSDTIFEGPIEISQEQLNSACASHGKGPQLGLPRGTGPLLRWHGDVCGYE